MTIRKHNRELPDQNTRELTDKEIDLVTGGGRRSAAIANRIEPARVQIAATK